MVCVRDLFREKRYAIYETMVKKQDLLFLYRYARARAGRGTMNVRDGQVPNTPSAGYDAVMDGLLNDLTPVVERASGLELFPTYSYFRVYKSGDILKRHTDRPACEISVTLCLGYEAPKPWPIWIEGPGGVASVELQPGDGLLYRGIECPHWREPFEGEHNAQVFLHYVDQHGPHAEWKFDKRPALSTLATQKR